MSDTLNPNDFNSCVESTQGAWEYYRDAKTGQISLLYFKPNSSTPDVEIPLTVEEWQDLSTLHPNVKKYSR